MSQFNRRKPAADLPSSTLAADLPAIAAPHPLPVTGGSFTLVDGVLVPEAETAPETAPETDR